jgi:hypothetical protein
MRYYYILTYSSTEYGTPKLTGRKRHARCGDAGRWLASQRDSFPRQASRQLLLSSPHEGGLPLLPIRQPCPHGAGIVVVVWDDIFLSSGTLLGLVYRATHMSFTIPTITVRIANRYWHDGQSFGQLPSHMKRYRYSQ